MNARRRSIDKWHEEEKNGANGNYMKNIHGQYHSEMKGIQDSPHELTSRQGSMHHRPHGLILGSGNSHLAISL